MESGVRSSGSGVLVKSRNSSGCLIVRKRGDGLGAAASTPRKLYESKKRPNINVSLSDSGSSDELLMPPGRSLGPETIRVCNGLAASERGGSEISRKRDRVEQIRGIWEGIAAERGLYQRETKHAKLDVYDFDEYDGMNVENMRRRQFDGNGGGRFVGSVHASRIGVDREFKTGRSGHVLDKRKGSHYDRPSGSYPGDNVDYSRFKINRDGARLPLPSQREKFNSDETIRVQGKNGVLKVMVNKTKVGGPSEHYDHRKPAESRQRLRSEESAKRLKTEETAKRLKTEETARRLKSEETAKKNVPICPSSYLETKPVEKPGLHKRIEKKLIASRKSLSGRNSKGDEGDSDNSDTSLNPVIRSTEAHKPAKKIISEDEQTPLHKKIPTQRTKEGKMKHGSGTEKQKLREKIREMLLNSGWTIDYRPRRNRDYLDAVYINPAGTAYWSIIKAYDALQKQLNDDADEALRKGDSSSFAPIADEVLSQLTRKTRKKMEKELKKKKKRYVGENDNEKEPQIRSASSKQDMNTDSDSDREKLSSFIKQGSKSMKNKMFENMIISARSKNQSGNRNSSDGIEKSLFGCDTLIHGRKSKKHGRCTLLVRSSNSGLNSDADDGFVPYMGKRTVLSWLIDSGTVELSQKVQYRRRKKVLLEGWITRDGIHCGCCSKILTVSKFELHAGSKLPLPYQNIYLESGVSLLQCQIDAWNRQEHSEKIGFHSVDIDGDDPNDDTCGICGDGGDLICCDGCPSTFHQSCLDIKMLPPGEWRCPNCTCKFCGKAGGTFEKEDASVYILHTCNLCEKKYHDSCTKEMDTLANNFNVSSLSFCGKECKELSEHLKKYLGTKHELEAGFSWSLIHRTDEDSEAALQGITQRVECNSKLAIALTVMDECFLPVIDRRSGINLIHNVLYNSGSNFSRLSYGGFYTAILERGDEIIAAASIRFHGTMIAEMPFIGTRHIYRRQGMCRRLFSAIELALCSLKVEKLVIPAIAELTDTWTTTFGFTHLDDSLRQEIKSLNMMALPGIDMLQKLLVEPEKLEGNTTTGFEKVENGDNDFSETKMGNRSDMGSTPQDPHGSDEVSSNRVNESNDECSNTSQELNNVDLVDGTLQSKSHSDEMLSDSISDKCVSPSSALQMKNEVVTASPVKLNPSSEGQSISLNDTSVSSHPLDILRGQALVQETACSEPCSTENLVKKCHLYTTMNCDSSELDMNPVLDSEVGDNTTASKEIYMNGALEIPSGNLSGENVTKGNNDNVDVSGSAALNHANESYLQVGSDSIGEIACVNDKDLHLNPGVSSN